MTVLPNQSNETQELDDILEGDYSAFAACEGKAVHVVGGFWSVFVTCAWIVSRCEAFTAAVQLYEKQHCVDQGGTHAAAAWLVLGNVMGRRFDVTLTQALDQLRAAIGDGLIDPGSGYDRQENRERVVERHEWRAMRVAYEAGGTSLVPGVYNLAWPSAGVRSAFPQTTQDEPAPPVRMVRPPERWQAQRVTDEQEELVRFLGFATQHLPGGANPLSKVELLARYQDWHRRNRIRSSMLQRSAFEKWVERYSDGWRVVGRKWELSQ